MNQQHRFIFWGVLLIVVLLSVSSITFPIFVAQTVKNQNVICIDAGHGGSDPGKVGNSNVLEKDINLSLALKLQKLLEKKNYKVYMTRNGDYNLADSKENTKRSDLSNRKQIIFENDPMAVISLHQNSYPSSDVHGAQVFERVCQGSLRLMVNSFLSSKAVKKEDLDELYRMLDEAREGKE